MTNPNKQLVLTGYSQGGGGAVVGAIRFMEYNPLTITLAGPATVKHPSSECTAINPVNTWRGTWALPCPFLDTLNKLTFFMVGSHQYRTGS